MKNKISLLKNKHTLYETSCVKVKNVKKKKPKIMLPGSNI